MVRKSSRVCGRLVMSAAISWSLIPIANADAPTSSDKQPEISNAAATRIVREITAKRPKEDLVICIAGCVGKQDRVVFAQPTEYVPPKPAATTADSGAKPAVPAPTKAASEKPETKPAKAATAPAKPAATPPAAVVMPTIAPANADAKATPASDVKSDAKPESNADAKPDVKSEAAAPAAPAASQPANVNIPAPLNAPKAEQAKTEPAAVEPGKNVAAPETKADAQDPLKKMEFVPSMSKPDDAAPAMEKEMTDEDRVKLDRALSTPADTPAKDMQPK
jgi:hypothetical protein